MLYSNNLNALEQLVWDAGNRLADGSNRKIKCPFTGCEGRANRGDTSLSVGRLGQDVVYKCHYCNAADRITPGDKHNDRKPVPPAPVKMQPAIVRPVEPSLGEKWLASRGIDPAKAAKWVKYEAAWFPALNENLPCISFVSTLNGKRVYSKHRALDQKEFASTGKAVTLYMLDDADFNKPLIITEGEPDALCLKTRGYNAVSLPAGAGSFGWLEAEQARLKKFPEIIYWTDNDDRGRAGLVKLKEQPASLRANFKFIEPDDFEQKFPGLKDANDMVLATQHPGAPLETMIDHAISLAKPLKLNFLFDVGGSQDALLRIRDGVYAERLSVGDPAIDRIYSPTKGYVTLITGIPGHGKSTWLNWYSSRLCQKYDWRVGVWSPENDPALHVADIAQIHAGRPLGQTASDVALTDEELEASMSWVNDHYKFIVDHEGDATIDTILDQILTLRLLHGVSAAIIDPWTHITLPPGLNAQDAVKPIFSKISNFAKKYNMHLWVVAHPTKMQQQWKSTEEWKREQDEGTSSEPRLKVPKGYDISGSANFYNMTDVGLTIYRDDGKTSVYCWKARRKFLGMEGRADLYYDVMAGDFQSETVTGPIRVSKYTPAYNPLDDF